MALLTAPLYAWAADMAMAMPASFGTIGTDGINGFDNDIFDVRHIAGKGQFIIQHGGIEASAALHS